MKLRTPKITLALSLALSLAPVFPAYADGGGKDVPAAAPEASALQMEWDATAPTKEISALSEECERRFPGKAHTCDVISRRRKNEKSLKETSLAADVVLGSDFGRRGKIYCKMGISDSKLAHPDTLPWLTIVQMQDFFESEKLSTHPWNCAIQKCDIGSGDCKKLGNEKLLKDSIRGFF